MSLRFNNKSLSSKVKFCKHLCKNTDQEYVFRFSGIANHLEALCDKCSKYADSNIQPDLRSVNIEQLNNLDQFDWTAKENKLTGRMQLPQAESEYTLLSEGVLQADIIAEKIVQIEPHPFDANKWFSITRTGRVLLTDITVKSAELLFELDCETFLMDKSLLMQLSHDAGYVAIANAYGLECVVVDTQSKKISMRFEREAYHTEHCYFPLVFLRVDNKPYLIHATKWNSLDISDPVTGKSIMDYSEDFDSEVFDRFNYDGAASFRGELQVSPQQSWIADNGWDWHPVGWISTWNLSAWLNKYPYEYVTGPSLYGLEPPRDYYWGQPTCWLDDEHLCVWGWGGEYGTLPAVVIYNIPQRQQVCWFPGPDGRLIFDEYLYALNEESGITVWDVEQGTCLLQDKQARAMSYHKAGHYFIGIKDTGDWIRYKLNKKSVI